MKNLKFQNAERNSEEILEASPEETMEYSTPSSISLHDLAPGSWPEASTSEHGKQQRRVETMCNSADRETVFLA